MKNFKLFTILFGVFILPSIGFSQDLKEDIPKIDTSFESQISELKNEKSDSQMSIDARFSTKVYKNSDWTRKVEDETYERGKIRTH